MPILDGLRSIFRRAPRDPGIEAAGKVGSAPIDAQQGGGILQPGGFGYELLRGFAPRPVAQYEDAAQQRLQNERQAAQDAQNAQSTDLRQEATKTSLSNIEDDRRRAGALRGAMAAEAAGGDFNTNLGQLAQRFPQMFTEAELAAGQEGGPAALRALLQDPSAASSGGALPAAIQEHQYFEALPEAQKARYLNLRRGENVGRAQLTGDGLVIPVTDQQGNTRLVNLGSPEEVGQGRATVERMTALGDRVGQNVADDLDDRYGKAQDAVNLLGRAQRAKELLGDGVISGPLADQRLTLARFVGAVTGSPAPDVANTDEYKAVVAEFTTQAIQALGSGTGLSDADREFAAAMSGGNMQAAATALRRIVDIVEDKSNERINDYNGRRTAIGRQDATALELYPELGVGEQSIDDLLNQYAPEQ